MLDFNRPNRDARLFKPLWDRCSTAGIKFPDLIHSVKPEPDRDFPQAQSAHDTFWDFISLTPESMHIGRSR